MSRLNGRVAIVTGGASGIGKEVAMALATAGCKIVIADISAIKLVLNSTKEYM